MSIALAAAEIQRFLQSSEPEVLCISGRWGVGKTFAWNYYLKDARGKNAIGLERYSYVSLFGQNSLADIRSSIVENTELLREASEAAGLKDWAEHGARYLAKLRYLIPPKWQHSLVVSERVLFAVLRSQIVCIDDLERLGGSLDIKDILGLVSQLREQKACKVVLLLNQDELANRPAFDAQIEKVADTVMEFKPSSAEAAKIGIDKSTSFYEALRENCVSLRITNVRLIKRIERLCLRLEEILREFDKRILQAAIYATTLFVYGKYQPTLGPSPKFLRTHGTYEDIKEQQSQPNNEGWRALLKDYGFGAVDEFDLVLLEGVERGYFDSDALKEQAGQKEAALHLEDQDNSMRQAWDLYHGSFDNNQDAVLDAMAAAFKENFESVTPMNVEGIARLFKDLGRPEQGRELVEYYVDNKEAQREFWDIKAHAFIDEITDPDLIELFKRKFDSFEVAEESPRDILLRISATSGWSRSDEERLVKLSADDFYKMFKETRGADDIRHVTLELQRFKRMGATEPRLQSIGQRADEALERIAQESAINRRRVELHRKRR